MTVIAIRDAVLFPYSTLNLTIKRPKSVAAVNNVMHEKKLALFLTQRDIMTDDPGFADCYHIGTVGKIKEIMRGPEETLQITVEGFMKARVTQPKAERPYLEAMVEPMLEEEGKKTDRTDAVMYTVINLFKEAISLGATVPLDMMMVILNLRDPWKLADFIVLNMELKIDERQRILEADEITEKLEGIASALGRQIRVLKIAKKLQNETGKEMDKMQREMFLREQLRSIEKELGTLSGEGKTEFEELRAKLEKAGMTEETKEQALKELNRYERMPSFSPEASYLRTYLDWLTMLPWNKKSEHTLDLKEATNILNQDHAGLEKVKERVLEYLAVQKLVGKIKGPIICFVGPPGTGKTSIGKSIARSLGRTFYRMSLGGIRDEAEIRGHRRTYVGALPGRIIQGINSVKTKNPVFMLDEIDKVGTDFRGDPSSALLEALDPEQNGNFSDHYLELPFDLSDVMFITTANILDTIPPALRDRMEVIEFPGYTEEEKFTIAKDFLIPKQLKEHGLDDTHDYLGFTDLAIRAMIRDYTKEAGVRELERSIASVCRKVAKRIEEGEKKKYTVNAPDLGLYLGPAKFKLTLAEKQDEVGVATGLAWTEAGGDILLIEATKMPGKGDLSLTGQLGKVMQESAQAALSYIRTNAKKLNIKDDFQKINLHVHVPAGAIPKDGPSAGISMATSLVSALTGHKIKRTVAMTGEITLRGKVLGIGGVKEKVLAAHRSGVKLIILPKENEKDMEEIPKPVRDAIKFVFVEDIKDVLKIALV